MAGGAWLIYDASQLQTQYEQQAKQRADEYRDTSRVRTQSRCVPLPREEMFQCLSEEMDTVRQGQQNEYDLQAQLVTSAWTRAMGIAAIIGMAVGIFGIGLVYTTFRETRRGVEKASEANRIARAGHLRGLRNSKQAAEDTAAALEHSRDNAAAMARLADAMIAGNEAAAANHRTLARAYVKGDVGAFNLNVGERIRFPIQWDNYGQTAALNCQTRTWTAVMPPGWEPNEEAIFQGDDGVPAILHRGGDLLTEATTAPGNLLTDELLARIRTGESIIYAGARINYEDVFGDEHFTDIRFEFGGPDSIRIGKVRGSPGSMST